MSDSLDINYVEFPSRNLSATKAFFERAFLWTFDDYGSEYCAFQKQGIEGGFFRSSKVATSGQGAPSIILYAKNLISAQQSVIDAGGAITKPVFEFPGGWRFHFLEPGGNELAVWSDVEPQ